MAKPKGLLAVQMAGQPWQRESRKGSGLSPEVPLS
jgi:hypothetical protein